MAGKNPTHTSGAKTQKSDSPVFQRPSIIGLIGSCLVAVVMLVVLKVADGQMFEDPEHSRLYKFTLDQAFSRFGDSDRQVPAKPKSGGQAGPQGVSPAQMQRMANFGKGGGALGGLPQGQQVAGQHRSGGSQHSHDDGGQHTKKGNDFVRTGNHAEAIKEFRLALKENPQRLQARHSLGDSLRALGRHDEAIASYREVLKHNPQYYCCYTHMGDIEKGRGNVAASEQAYAKAIDGYKQQVQSGGATAPPAKYHLAKLYYDSNRSLPEALKFAEEANAATPGTFAYLQVLAQIYEKLGRPKDAIAKYDELIKIAPKHAQYLQQQKQRLTGTVSKQSAN